ncbi:hypothetical protein [Nocardioides phosphati]|nr:hypothetical protein [Nocardioides phosphati]
MKSVARADMTVREVALWVGIAIPATILLIVLLALLKSKPRVTGRLESGTGRLLGGLGVFMVALWGAAVSGAAAGTALLQDDPRPDVMPGYHSAITQNGRPLAVGAPWGPPCTPVVVFTGEGVDRVTFDAAQAAVARARRQGVNVTMATRDGHYRLDAFASTPTSEADVAGVWLNQDPTPTPPKGASGPMRYSLQWLGKSGTGDTDVFESLGITIYSASVDGDAATIAKATDYLIAASHGVFQGTTQGTALTPRLDDAAQQFSDQDVTALLTGAGCPLP